MQTLCRLICPVILLFVLSTSTPARATTAASFHLAETLGWGWGQALEWYDNDTLHVATTYALWTFHGDLISRPQQPLQRLGFVPTTSAISPDGAHFTATDGEGHIYRWRDDDVWQMHTIPFTASQLAVDDDGRVLVLERSETTWYLHDLETALTGGEPLLAIDRGIGHETFAYDHGRTRLARLANDGQVSVWDIEAGQRIFSEVLREPVRYEIRSGIAFSPDGDLLAVPDAGNIVRVWDLSHDFPVVSAEHHFLHDMYFGSVERLGWSPDGETIVVIGSLLHTGARGGLAFWSLVDGDVIFRDDVPGFVSHLAFSPDSTRVATLDWGGHLSIFDLKKGQLRHRLHGFSRVPNHMSLSFDEQSVIIVQRPRVYRWEIATGSSGSIVVDDALDPREAHLTQPLPDGDLIVVRHAPDAMRDNVERWTLGADGEYGLSEMNLLQEFEWEYGWMDDDVALFGDTLISVSASPNRLYFIDLITGDATEVEGVGGHRIAASPSANRIMICMFCHELPFFVTLLDGSGEILVQESIPVDDQGVSFRRSVAFAIHPNGETFVHAINESLRLFETDGFNVRWMVNLSVNDALFDPHDPERLIVAGDDGISIVAVEDGRIVANLYDSPIDQLAVSASGSLLIAIGVDGVIRLWRR